MPRIDDSKSRSQVLRQEDGIHFTGYGYRLLGAKVLAAVSAPVDPEK